MQLSLTSALVMLNHHHRLNVSFNNDDDHEDDDDDVDVDVTFVDRNLNFKCNKFLQYFSLFTFKFVRCRHLI
jgi:hypothetical protein